jgi:drug/metabolite transporter (DMT)-like permease
MIKICITNECRITANQGFYLLGLDNTSPTFASAIQNSVPAITFLMAVILRIEQVRLNRKDGIGKVVGTLFCVLGASVITLYKGPTIYSPVPPLHNNSGSSNSNSIEVFESISVLGDAKGKNWTLGCLYLIGHCLSWSGWLVLQAPVLKKYPARLSVTSYTCFFGLIQFLIIALIVERDAQAWIFQSGGEVFTILYAVSNLFQSTYSYNSTICHMNSYTILENCLYGHKHLVTLM